MLARRLAIACALSTFVLLIIGGTVNPTGSSLACPEPTIVCHGKIFPKMTGGVLYEHGHRLAAMLIGLLQIALTATLLSKKNRPLRLRGLGVLTLAMVLFQGALGALTVKYKLPWQISTAHLMLALTYFATLILIAYRAHPRPETEAAQLGHWRAALGSGRHVIVAVVAALAVQLLLGGLVRHHEATLVCLGMPQCTPSGDWLPAAGIQRLHMLHRAFGVVVAVGSTIGAFMVLRRARGWATLRMHMFAAPLLVGLQVALGVYTVLTMRSVPVAVAHFAGAIALWALWISAWLLARTPAADTPRSATRSQPDPAALARGAAL